jgi:hypothetical protein
MPDVGVIGTLVWDEIHGRDPAAPVVEEWGGIAYALASFDAHLPDGWRIVPLIKVGQDLARDAAGFLGTLRRLAPGARCAEVPAPNNRVVLHYRSAERRCERMSGGVPGWTWAELGPMVRDLDALYVNFISGFELSLGTAQALRHGYGRTIYADFHSLLLGLAGDGTRIPRPLPDAPSWFGCFDVIQMNEEEMGQLGSDPLALAAGMLAVGVKTLIVTLGARGAVYVAAGGNGRAVTTERVPAASIADALDPTGCGDVFGGAVCSRLLAGDPVAEAVTLGNRAAARNVGFRGATGLAAHLRGELVTP